MISAENKKKTFEVHEQPTQPYSFYISERLRAPVNVRPFGAGLSFGVKMKL